MGRWFSRPETTPPPPSPTLSKPWRKVNWGNKEVDLQYVKDYQPQREDIKHLRILLYGPVGAGKSSFINSVSSVLQGEMKIPAQANNSTESDKSFTKKVTDSREAGGDGGGEAREGRGREAEGGREGEAGADEGREAGGDRGGEAEREAGISQYKTHKIKKGEENPQTYYPVVLNDIMGLEEGSGSGVHPDDIKLAMKGHVKDGYKFNPVYPLSSGDPDYNPEPSADDKAHVLVCVHSANSAEIKPSVLQKMRDIRETANNLEIPQMAIITKIDEACGETEKDLKNVYQSTHLKKKMEDFSAAVGIPMNCIFPIKNYWDQIENNNDVDSLILSALRRMIDCGDGFINKT